MGALTEKGFKRPLYADLLESQIKRAKQFFGEDIDTSETTPFGKFIRLAVYDLAEAYEDLENCYYARFPNSARGADLDRVCFYAGITRNPATQAIFRVGFTGTVGYTIKTGFLIGTALGVNFYLDEDVKLELDEETGEGIGQGLVSAVDSGVIGNVTPSEITVIVNPDASVSSVIGIERTTTAANAETDTELRKRFSDTVAGIGSATYDSIRAAILRVKNVQSCYIIENSTNETVDGRPPHSFEPFVICPTEQYQAVADAIFSKKPIGIMNIGNESFTCTANDDTKHTIKFSLTEEIPVYIKISVKAIKDFNGVNEIKDKLVDYFNHFEIGQDVVVSALYQYIYQVEGVKDTSSLTLSTDGESYSASNIPIQKTQIARLSTGNITVEVSEYVDY